MSHPHRPNRLLGRAIEESRASRKALAHRINELAERDGVNRSYTHTSFGNWVERGVQPRPPATHYVAIALGERLGRIVTLDEIGLNDSAKPRPEVGFDFPRDPADARRNAAEYWSTMDRRNLLANAGFAISSFSTPLTRWLVSPVDPLIEPPDQAHRTHPAAGRVGRADLDELWQEAEEARRWDSKFGGGNWKSSRVVDCLQHRAAPMLLGAYSEKIERELFNVTAELARVAAWSEFDMGNHALAQRHFIQALRLAKASGDIQTGAYVLATMSLQAMLRGYPREAIDMAEGAYERAKHEAAPRVLAFAKLAQARAHGKAGEERAAAAALSESERLLHSIREGVQDPSWLAYLTHARISADATEIYADLNNPLAAIRWNQQADAMPAGIFTRAVAIRQAVIGTAHIQAGELDAGIAMGEKAVTSLTGLRSARAEGYLRTFITSLDPWRRDQRVNAFIQQSHQVLRAV